MSKIDVEYGPLDEIDTCISEICFTEDEYEDFMENMEDKFEELMRRD